MPLWPGTNYQWTVSPVGAGEVVEGQGDHKAFVKWDPGHSQGVLTVNYEHHLLGPCSAGSDSLGIDINPVFEVTGPESVCDNTGTVNFDITGGGGTGNFDYIITEDQTGNQVSSGQVSGPQFSSFGSFFD